MRYWKFFCWWKFFAKNWKEKYRKENIFRIYFSDRNNKTYQMLHQIQFFAFWMTDTFFVKNLLAFSHKFLWKIILWLILHYNWFPLGSDSFQDRMKFYWTFCHQLAFFSSIQLCRINEEVRNDYFRCNDKGRGKRRIYFSSMNLVDMI